VRSSRHHSALARYRHHRRAQMERARHGIAFANLTDSETPGSSATNHSIAALQPQHPLSVPKSQRNGFVPLMGGNAAWMRRTRWQPERWLYALDLERPGNVRHELRLRGVSSCCMDHLSYRPSRSWSARSKSRRWRHSVAVFLLRNSRIKLHPQQWNRLNRATRAMYFRNSNLIGRVSRGVEQ
jgi:hypothetical protein